MAMHALEKWKGSMWGEHVQAVQVIMGVAPDARVEDREELVACPGKL